MAQVQTTDGLPSVNPRPTAPNGYGGIQVSPDAFGAGVARAREGFSQDLQKVSGDFFKKAEVFQQIQADDAVNKSMSAINGHLDQFKTLQGQDALRARPDTEKEIDAAVKAGRKGLGFDQGIAYDSALNQYRRGYVQSTIASHSDTAARSYADSTNKAFLDLSLNNTASAADEEQAEPFRHDVRAALVRQLQLTGNAQDPVQFAAAVQNADQAFYKTRIQSVGQNNPMAALALAEKNKEILGDNFAPIAEALKNKSDDMKAQVDAGKYLGMMDNPLSPGTAMIPGADPRQQKAHRLLDQAAAMAKIDEDYKTDPALGRRVRAVVNERFQIARTEQQAQQLQRSEGIQRVSRSISDFIYKDPTKDIEPLLAANPNLPASEVEHLRDYREKTVKERLTGSPGNWGPGFAGVVDKIYSNGPDKIRNVEQLGPLLRTDDLNSEGYKEAARLIEEVNKPGAEAAKTMQSNFIASAKKAVTLEFEGYESIVSPARREAWDNALPIVMQSLAAGRAKGYTDAQMMSHDSKESIWPALKPFLPTDTEAMRARVAAAAAKDAKAGGKSAPVKLDDLKTEAAALAAFQAGDINIEQAKQLWNQHKWGAPTEAAPRVPTGGP